MIFFTRESLHSILRQNFVGAKSKSWKSRNQVNHGSKLIDRRPGTPFTAFARKWPLQESLKLSDAQRSPLPDLFAEVEERRSEG